MTRHNTKKKQFAKYGISLFTDRFVVEQPWPPHTHDFSELVVITKGEADHFIDNETYRVTAGNVYIMHGDVRHCFLNVDNFEVINIMFDLSDLEISLDRLNLIHGFRTVFHLEPGVRKMHKFASRLHLDPGQLEYITQLHADLQKELEMKDRSSVYILKSILIHIFVYLSRCYENISHHRHVSLMSLSRVVNYIELNYIEEITLNRLAQIAHMSESTLLRKFHEALSDTPIDYLQKYRLKKACEMLLNTDKTVTEIAFDIGFNSVNYFCRYFKKNMDRSPLEYRKL